MYKEKGFMKLVSSTQQKLHVQHFKTRHLWRQCSLLRKQSLQISQNRLVQAAECLTWAEWAE